MNTHILDHRSPWPAWAATAIAVLGLVGLAAAQQTPSVAADALLSLHGPHRATRLSGPPKHAAPAKAPISDDGRDTDLLPVINELVIARAEQATPIAVRILDEHGRVVRTYALDGTGHRALPIGLDGLAAGRYVARITGVQQTRSLRFRKP